MVSTSTIIAVCVTLFISLFLPVIIWIVYGLKNRKQGVWSAWLLGAAGFFVMQVVLRLPILSLLSLSKGFSAFAEEHYILYCLALAVTAGLFEVAGRYVVAKLMQKNLTYRRGIAAGLGHGGIEAMILVGMTYINNLIYIAMINTGSFDGIIEQTAQLGADTASLTAVREALTGTAPVMFYLAGYERILTMILHVALSLLVCYFVWKKKDVAGIVICLVIHSAVDFVSVVLSGLSVNYLGGESQTTGYSFTYIFLTVVAIGAVLGICRIRKLWKQNG